MDASNIILIALAVLFLAMAVGTVVWSRSVAHTKLGVQMQSLRNYGADIFDGVLAAGVQVDQEAAVDTIMGILGPKVKTKDQDLLKALVQADVQRMVQISGVAPQRIGEDPQVLDGLQLID